MAWPWAGREPSLGHPTRSHCSESPTPGRPSTHPQEMGTFCPGQSTHLRQPLKPPREPRAARRGGGGPRRPRAHPARLALLQSLGHLPSPLSWECPAPEDLDPRQHTRGARRLRVSEMSPVRRRQSIWCHRTRADLGQDPVPSFCKCGSGSRCRSEAPGRGVLSARPYGGHKYLQSPALGLREAVHPGLRSAAMPGRIGIPRQPGDERRPWEAGTSPWALTTTEDPGGRAGRLGREAQTPPHARNSRPVPAPSSAGEVACGEGGRSAQTPDALLPAACGAGLLGSRARRPIGQRAEAGGRSGRARRLPRGRALSAPPRGSLAGGAAPAPAAQGPCVLGTLHVTRRSGMVMTFSACL